MAFTEPSVPFLVLYLIGLFLSLRISTCKLEPAPISLAGKLFGRDFILGLDYISQNATFQILQRAPVCRFAYCNRRPALEHDSSSESLWMVLLITKALQSKASGFNVLWQSLIPVLHLDMSEFWTESIVPWIKLVETGVVLCCADKAGFSGIFHILSEVVIGTAPCQTSLSPAHLPLTRL